MQQPLVSFCFTTYKRRDYLQQTLQSVRAQSYTNFEVIVSDNDPEGSGRSVVEGFQDNRFKYYVNEQNLGMKKSFNRSLEHSAGEYIVMIADDDPVYPDMLETLIGLTDKYPGYGMYLGGCNWFCTNPDIAALYGLKVGVNSQLAAQPIGAVTAYSGSEFLKDFFNFGIFPTYLWSTAIVKRMILTGNGGVPDYNTPFLGDYAYLSIMGAQSGCVVVNKALGHQTIHEQNFGRAQNEQLTTVAVNFIDYVSDRIKHVDDWPVIEKNMKNFVGLWVLTHLSFLKKYYAITGNKDGAELDAFEKEIFRLPLMKPFRLKYWLKKHTPGLHDFIVVQKRKLNKAK